MTSVVNLAPLAPASELCLEPRSMTLTAIILLILKLSIALNVLSLGLRATLADTTYLFRRPELLVRAFLSMNVLMPLLALIIAIRFSLHPAVKIALVALSVSPVPPIFPRKALKAGGKEDYTIGLLVAAGLLSIAVVPITLEIFQRVLGIPLHEPVRDVAILIFRTILGPLLLGIGLRAMIPSWAERFAKPVGVLGAVLLVLTVIPVLLGSAKLMFSLIGNGTLLAMTVFAAAGLVIGHLFGGTEFENRRVLSLATATRHPGMAIAIAHANFPDEKLALPAAALYLLVAGILTAIASRLESKSELASAPRQRKAA